VRHLRPRAVGGLWRLLGQRLQRCNRR
jgi:hypothetical protein